MISFQEVCLMYCGEKDIANIDKERLIYCMHIYEGLVSLDKSVQDRVKLQEVMAQLESMTKMRDNWKADCEYSEKCFQA